MPQPLSERTASFTDSVIRRMTRISLKYGAVNLSQGFPDFDPPQEILDRLAQVARRAPTSIPSPGEPRTSGRPWPENSLAAWAAPSTPTRRSWPPAAPLRL